MPHDTATENITMSSAFLYWIKGLLDCACQNLNLRLRIILNSASHNSITKSLTKLKLLTYPCLAEPGGSLKTAF